MDPSERAVIVYDSGIDIWERQTWETDRQWAAFQIFRNITPSRRSVAAAHRTAFPDTYAPFSVQRWRKWANALKWRDRALAYDQYVDEQMRAELEERRIRARIATANLGEAMRTKAMDSIKALRAITTEIVRGPDGNPVRRVKSVLSPREIATLADVGVKLERLALGEVDGAGGLQVNVGVQVVHKDEELIERATEVIESRAQVVNGGD